MSRRKAATRNKIIGEKLRTDLPSIPAEDVDRAAVDGMHRYKESIGVRWSPITRKLEILYEGPGPDDIASRELIKEEVSRA